MAYNNRTNLPPTNPLQGGAAGAVPTYGSTPASGPAPHTAGHHRHDILNKLDPAVDSSRDKVPLPPPGTATNGPHSSRLANKLDPTVDTSAYESRNLGAGAAAAGYGHQGDMVSGTTAYGQQHHQAGVMSGTTGAREGTYGPHSSRMANAADPRVDSDRDGRAAMHGAAGTGTAGYGHSSTAPGMGPMGAGYGQPGYGGATAAHGVGYGQSHQYGGQHVAGTSMLPGPAPNTAGPHKSDLLNKLDPTVDSKGGPMMTERGQRRI